LKFVSSRRLRCAAHEPRCLPMVPSPNPVDVPDTVLADGASTPQDWERDGGNILTPTSEAPSHAGSGIHPQTFSNLASLWRSRADGLGTPRVAAAPASLCQAKAVVSPERNTSPSVSSVGSVPGISPETDCTRLSGLAAPRTPASPNLISQRWMGEPRTPATTSLRSPGCCRDMGSGHWSVISSPQSTQESIGAEFAAACLQACRVQSPESTTSSHSGSQKSSGSCSSSRSLLMRLWRRGVHGDSINKSQVLTPNRLSISNCTTCTPGVKGGYVAPACSPCSPCAAFDLPGPGSTPSTARTSRSGCTSISTPDSRHSGDSSFALESEMELALELVNHVPPDIADRLIGRLRETEAARTLADARCVTATAFLEDNGSPSPHQSFFDCRCRRVFSKICYLSVVLGLAAVMIVAGVGCESSKGIAPDFLRYWVEQPTISAASQLRRKSAVAIEAMCPPWPIQHGPGEVCEEMLQEVLTANEELRKEGYRRSSEYAHVLASMGNLNSFLLYRRDTMGNSEPVDVGVVCAEAAHPGQAALLELVRAFAIRQGELASQLSVRKVMLNDAQSGSTNERPSILSGKQIGSAQPGDDSPTRAVPFFSTVAAAIVSWVERTW